MSVSQHDRDQLARIGEYKTQSHSDVLREHLKRTIPERLLRSWSLYQAGRKQMRAGIRGDDPSPFYERARRLGHYRIQDS